MSSPIVGAGGSLSLQQKQKMLADSENLKRMTNQPKLSPMSSGGSTTNANLPSKGSMEAKDLTASLMTANLNQIQSGQSASGGSFNKMGSSNNSMQGILHKTSQAMNAFASGCFDVIFCYNLIH